MKAQGNRILGAHEELEQGCIYTVERFNGTHDDRVSAELVHVNTVCDSEIKKIRGVERNLGNPDATDETTERSHKLYYVHYIGQDRRLDEWVERERFVEFVSDAGNSQENIPESGNKGTMTRAQRKMQEEFHHALPTCVAMDAVTAKLEKEHEEFTKVKHINHVIFGRYDILAWYYSPFPEYAQKDVIYVCEFCLGYTPDKDQYICHKFHQCNATKPPGIEIYRKGKVAVYEVDGSKEKIYCQCLCLVSKLFMDHKTLYYDVGSFLFYIVCEVSADGARIAGHFSKERLSANNLACIMVLPQFQRMGYGKFLIQFSYELSKREGWIGGPERPLSDLGKISYRRYWWWKILIAMESLGTGRITTKELADHAGIEEHDVDSTLGTVNIVRGFRGEHMVHINSEHTDALKKDHFRPPILLVDPRCLHWKPQDAREIDI